MKLKLESNGVYGNCNPMEFMGNQNCIKTKLDVASA